MDKKTTDIVAYITWVGLLIAYLAGDKENCKFHLNQSLVIILGQFALGVIVGIGAFIPFVGWIFSIAGGIGEIAFLVAWILGLVGAIQGEEKPLPYLSQIQIIK